MVEYIVVPGLGMSFEYVILTKWLKNVGDYIKKDEPVAEVTSDKITMELSSPIDGYLLKQCYKVDDSIPVNAVVAILGTNRDEQLPDEFPNKKKEEHETKNTEEKPSLKNAKKRKLISPVAKRMIAEYNLDPDLIEGTDKDGMISKKDVENFLEQLKTSGVETNALNKDIETNKEIESDMVEIIPYTGIRKVIGDNLSKSISTAVHVTTGVEVDMTDVIALRKKIMKQMNIENLSIVAFAVRAVIEALKEFPILNSELKDNKILVKKYVNVGIAVAGEKGLIVPVIKDAHKKSLLEINNEIKIFTEQERQNKIPSECFKDGTITISNAGAFGSIISTPIINQPQSALIWMGKATKKPAVVNDEITIRSIMNLLCSYDHRVMDGSTVGLFLSRMKTFLENPESLLIS